MATRSVLADGAATETARWCRRGQGSGGTVTALIALMVLLSLLVLPAAVPGPVRAPLWPQLWAEVWAAVWAAAWAAVSHLTFERSTLARTPRSPPPVLAHAAPAPP
jgi:hypothetical protein